MVEAARRGELSPEEEQALLGLDAKGYRDLRAVQAAAQKQSKAMLEQPLRKPAAEEAPMRGVGGPQAGMSTPEEPSRDPHPLPFACCPPPPPPPPPPHHLTSAEAHREGGEGRGRMLPGAPTLF